MTLIDPERFAGRFRDGEMRDVSDVMRRLVKENLRTFEGKRIFPPRFAPSLNFTLSGPESQLYEAVTSYVRTGMNRAVEMQEGADRRRGIIVGFALAGCSGGWRHRRRRSTTRCTAVTNAHQIGR